MALGRGHAATALAVFVGCAGSSEVTGGSDGETEGATATGATASTDAGTTTVGTTAASHDASSGGTGESADTASGSTGERGLGPPYPIVLAHGFFGFEDFAGVDFVDYFWELPAHLQMQGEPLVFTPTVDPFNDSTIRGQQLLAEVEAIVQDTGYAKVNLIGHSQGGLDARVVAFERPDLVASVTTIATPHHGSPVADIALGIVDDPGAQALVDWLAQTLGAPLWPEIDGQTSLAASMMQFSEPGMDAFNDAYPDAEGIPYWTIAGRSGGSDGGLPCEVEDAPAFVTDWLGETDPIDPLFAPTEAILDGGLFSNVPNDGLVLVSDAKWGRFLGCIPADHVDQIGHLFGDRPGVLNDWEYRAFYTDLIAWLRAQGV
jgi:triacylglycerol lipase